MSAAFGRSPGSGGAAPPADRPVRGRSLERTGDFRRSLLTHVLIVMVPTGTLLFFGKAIFGGYGFWLLFLVLSIRLAFRGEAIKMLCLLMALAPFMNLLRDFAFYNVVTALLVLAIAHCQYRSPGTLQEVVARFPLIVPLLAMTSLYYAISFYLTGDYSANLRFFELAFGVVALLLISRDKRVLGGTLTGLMFSSLAVGVSMLPHVDTDSALRLGMMEIEDVYLGNPVMVGLPLALSFLALTVDGGAWLGLKRWWVRGICQAASLGLLLLTTSRASWMVVAVGVTVILLIGRGQRLRILILIGLGAVVVQLLLLSPYKEGLENGIRRTFAEDRSAANRTSGRSDQWLVASRALTDSLGSLIHGYGPGLGPITYARFSRELMDVHYGVGRRIALHSLYMQVAVEAGLLGLVPLIGGLLIILFRTIRWYLIHGLLMPMVAFLSYASVALTVSGNDTVSAVFLGIGFLATLRPKEPARSRSSEERISPVAHLRPVEGSA